jgi:glycosyltransferase involved in cell wall biosynthesis
MSKRILVIIPAYNEEGVVGRVVDDLLSLSLSSSMDVLVVDDGSKDGTTAEAKQAGARVVKLLQNLGYGNALKTGYRVASQEDVDIVVQMDGDGQHAAASLVDLLKPVLNDEADVVIGSRALSDVHYPMPFARRMGQKFFAFLLKTMSGLTIQDPTSGYQVLNRRAYSLYLSPDFPGDYPDTDVLLFLSLNGLRITEQPAEFRVNERGTSMHNGIIKPTYYIYKMVFSMILVYWRMRIRRKKGIS